MTLAPSGLQVEDAGEALLSFYDLDADRDFEAPEANVGGPQQPRVRPRAPELGAADWKVNPQLDARPLLWRRSLQGPAAALRFCTSEPRTPG